MSDQLAIELAPAVEHLVSCGARFSRRKHTMMSRPVLGGCFGDGAYRMYSWAHDFTGLHEVTYYVVHDDSTAILAVAPTKGEALSVARELLVPTCPVRLNVFFAMVKKGVAEAVAALAAIDEQKRAEWREKNEREVPLPTRLIPKRRRQVFEASDGKCHYCSCALTLDGKWHVEHRMPKALQGDNAPSNLVASCTACNFEKRDQTDQEYIAKRGKRRAANT